MRRWPVVLLLGCLATPALAHDTWLRPVKARIAPGETCVFELSSGLTFARPEIAVFPGRLVASHARLAGRTVELHGEAQATLLTLSAVLPGSGVAAAWIETRPRSLELTPDEVTEYLDEIDATPTIRETWRKRTDKTWVESYVKIAKTYLRLGDPAPDRSWAEPLGLALELIPGSDPTQLKVGDTFSVQLLWEGKPLAAQPVGAAPDGAKGTLRNTDAGGKVSFVLDHPGAWLVRVTRLRPDKGQPGRWTSHFSTLTLDVAPASAPALGDRPGR